MKPEHIAIILIASENADNIGAAARAMKNMGFSDLRLVRPPEHWRSKGKKMAMSAADILKKAKTYPSLQKAIQDLTLVVGTTRRSGRGRGFFLPFSKTIEQIKQTTERQKAGVVFGCESKGLANRDLRLCDHAVTIPTSAAYPSLNLAQAVMILLFALSRAENTQKQEKETQENFLNKAEMGIALQHFEKALKKLGYQKGGANLLPRILQTLHGLFKRSGLLPKEAQMMKGLSRRICEKVLSCPRGEGKISQKE